jgi:methylmalonyl-CoA mutase, C-terminal domain
MGLVPRLLELLRANGQFNVKVFVGGIIPEADILELLNMGVLAVYGPGTPSSKYVPEIQQAVWGRETG